MRIALVQFNPTVGDLAGNAARAADVVRRAEDAGAHLVVLPELALSGYPPKDLLLQEGFVEEAARRAAEVARAAGSITAVVGAPRRVAPGDPHSGVANSLLVMSGGRVTAHYDKRLLPTYDVFDEDRYFVAGDRPCVVDVAGARVGLSVCEDLWRGEDVGLSARYRAKRDPAADLVEAGATLIVNPSASPFALRKGARQRDVLIAHVARLGVPIAAVNQVGGNDELIFDGHAAVYLPDASSPRGARLVAAGPGFREEVTLYDLSPDGARWRLTAAVEDPLLAAPDEQLVWEALTLGVRDYCRKTGFRAVVIGLSGGIDSSVTACIAVGALGPENVLGVSMPSRFSSPGSRSDAADLADLLGVRMVTAPIEEPHAAMERLLAPAFAALGADAAAGVAEENVQSRLRGLILMAFSNKLGRLLITTGNKSELGVGYCTLYGDMNGGLAAISDLTKREVYALARWINANAARCGFRRAPIPPAAITKPPSAELRPDQTDQDTLPPYDEVDEIVARYVVGRQSPDRIAQEAGLARGVVAGVVRLIDISEHKRRQTPVGLKVTDVAFGSGRRMPIAQGWRPDRSIDPRGRRPRRDDLAGEC